MYSRGKGCRKKGAQTSSHTNVSEDMTTLTKQQQIQMELQTSNNRGTSQQLPSDSGPEDLDSQPEKRNSIQTRNNSNNNLLEEAIAQWEMVKDLGMTCGAEEPNIIDKIKSMELRDRKEAAVLGKRTTPP